jgi:hypothetical protein
MPEQSLALGTFDIATEQKGIVGGLVQEICKPLAACPERLLTEIPAIDGQEVKGDKARLTGHPGAKRVKVCPPLLREDDRLAVDDEGFCRQSLDGGPDPRERVSPIQSVSRP